MAWWSNIVYHRLQWLFLNEIFTCVNFMYTRRVERITFVRCLSVNPVISKIGISPPLFIGISGCTNRLSAIMKNVLMTSLKLNCEESEYNYCFYIYFFIILDSMWNQYKISQIFAIFWKYVCIYIRSVLF